ncbi:MAG: hypothetical protein RLZZ543_1287 [Bacteroidota bacterium]|jgi:putative mRNA 3-end processing factor
MDLLQFTRKGIYCPPADVFLDPSAKVDRALISHAHSDHARGGSLAYLAHTDSEAVLRLRLGKNLPVETVAYGKVVDINGVRFSFHPAGHVIGSAQIRVEYKGEVWVYTGDYKLEDDGLTVPFEPVKCHTLITESTFGMPVYQWQAQAKVMQEMNEWWRKNAAAGICTVVHGYSLGKSQRMLSLFDHSIGPVYCHEAIESTNAVFRAHGIALPNALLLHEHVSKEALRSALVITPFISPESPMMQLLEPYSLGIASGWMGLGGAKRMGAADRGFVLSDHADFPSLNTAVKESAAERIIVTHGFKEVYARWLCTQGYEAEAAQISM